ncbi:MAG TPA: hypothetical protein VEX15_11455 [Nocardioidaceae bacterium]|nr:hypothetical protein [Nocardioidaceae bacterium]
MNDLLPPGRRSIPEQRRRRMREKLDAEIEPTTTNRTHSLGQRFGIPAVAAAAVAAIAIGGYLLATNGGDDGRDADPAGQGTGVTHDGTGPERHESKEHGSKEHGSNTDSKGLVSTPVADPSQAYEKCIDLTVNAYRLRGEPIDGPLTGRLAIENEVGTTVVVTSSSDAYTCNIKPDEAVSRPAPLDGKVDEEDLWFALNATGNVLPGNEGDMVWVGGEAPDGVTGIQYAFPDGHTETAVVQDGFWALQYYADGTIPSGRGDRIEATLDGADAQTIELPFTFNTECNQVSHGC